MLRMDRITSSLGAGDVSAQLQALIDYADTEGYGGLRMVRDAEFSAAGLVLPSRFELDLNGSTVTHPDGEGSTAQSIVGFATSSTTADVSLSGVVTSAAPISDGVVVRIQAAGEVIRSQVSTLVSSIGASDTTITVTDTGGWAASSIILIGSELVSYSSYDNAGTFSGCVRGVLGTTAAAHDAGGQLALAGDLYAVHRSGQVSPPPARAVVGAQVESGATSSWLHGGRLVGERESTASTLPNVYGVEMAGSFRCSLTDLHIEEFDHAGVFVHAGASENEIAPTVTIEGVGEPGYRAAGEGTAGACVWLFGGASRNRVMARLKGEWQNGVFLDDRSVKASTSDQVPVGNVVDIEADCTPLFAGGTSIAVSFGGFVDDTSATARASGCTRGISLAGSGQGPVVGFASRFVVGGQFRNVSVGVLVGSTASDGVIGPVVTDSTVTTAITNNSATTTDLNP
jgi:hypothetical protein